MKTKRRHHNKTIWNWKKTVYEDIGWNTYSSNVYRVEYLRKRKEFKWEQSTLCYVSTYNTHASYYLFSKHGVGTHGGSQCVWSATRWSHCTNKGQVVCTTCVETAFNYASCTYVCPQFRLPKTKKKLFTICKHFFGLNNNWRESLRVIRVTWVYYSP